MPRASHSPGKALARERASWLKARAEAELRRLKVAITVARRRRREALQRARAQCRKARVNVRLQVKEFRSREMARINAEVAELRAAARNQCEARKYRIRTAGERAIARKAAEARAELTLQRKLKHADRHGVRRLNTAIERRAESDDAVRSNLPAELLPVFERVKSHIRGSRHRTRTEAFLEWAEEHPEDVLAYQGDATDREVARLVAEHEATERQLRKTRPRAARRRAAGDDDVPF